MGRISKKVKYRLPDGYVPRTISCMKWEIIRHEFITTPITLDDLAKKYNLSIGTLKSKSYSERWFVKRREYCDVTKSPSKFTKFLSLEAKNIIKERMTRIAKFKAVIDNGLDRLLNDKTLKIKSKETLISALVEASKHMELLLGNATERSETMEERDERISRIRSMFTGMSRDSRVTSFLKPTEETPKLPEAIDTTKTIDLKEDSNGTVNGTVS